MKHTASLFGATILLIAFASSVRGQTLTIDATDNTTPGTIKANGKWSIPAGATLDAIQLLVRPSGGGKGQGGAPGAAIQQMNWNASATKLPKGLYDVQAMMTYIHQNQTHFQQSGSHFDALASFFLGFFAVGAGKRKT